jgi:3-oxoacyl-[acyl-carrier protein] reductase
MILNLPAAFRAMGVAQNPIPRMAAPEEIATVALFLASDDSSYCTGQTLEPNGGMHM